MSRLEPIARAICIAAGLDPDRGGNETDWRWEEFLKEARAAVGALREPGDEAIQAVAERLAAQRAAANNPNEAWREDGRPYWTGFRDEARATLNAMIDALLQEEDEPCDAS